MDRFYWIFCWVYKWINNADIVILLSYYNFKLKFSIPEVLGIDLYDNCIDVLNFSILVNLTFTPLNVCVRFFKKSDLNNWSGKKCLHNNVLYYR